MVMYFFVLLCSYLPVSAKQLCYSLWVLFWWICTVPHFYRKLTFMRDLILKLGASTRLGSDKFLTRIMHFNFCWFFKLMLNKKYSGFGIQRTAIIPSFMFFKWLVHYVATLLLITATDGALTVVLSLNGCSLNTKSTVVKFVWNQPWGNG